MAPLHTAGSVLNFCHSCALDCCSYSVSLLLPLPDLLLEYIYCCIVASTAQDPLHGSLLTVQAHRQQSVATSTILLDCAAAFSLSCAVIMLLQRHLLPIRFVLTMGHFIALLMVFYTRVLRTLHMLTLLLTTI